MNTKTVDRAFTVLLCLIVVFVMIMAVTPLSFASSISGSTNRVQLKTDSRKPYLTNQFFGLNSGMIDVKVSNGKYRRFVFDNNKVSVNVLMSGAYSYLWFSPNDSNITTILYYYDIGTTYQGFSSGTWTSLQLLETEEFTLQSSNPNMYIFNCAVENGFGGNNTLVTTSNIYPNGYYPIMEQSTVNLNTVYDNQSSIIDKVNENESKNQSRYNAEESKNQSRYDAEQSKNQSRYDAEQSAQSSRQAEIMSEGSDITVSTIDNWIGGNNGLAEKLTRLAETLSNNVYRFSENQNQVAYQLQQAGTLVHNAFQKIPTSLIACMFCFLIILIAVKVIGR